MHFNTILNTQKIRKTVTILKLINQLMKGKIRTLICIAKIISNKIWLKETHFWIVGPLSRWLLMGFRKKWLKLRTQEFEYYQCSLKIIKSDKWSSYYQNILRLKYIKADAFVALNITQNKVDITNLKRKQYHLWNFHFPSFQDKSVGILIGVLIIF